MIDPPAASIRMKPEMVSSAHPGCGSLVAFNLAMPLGGPRDTPI